MPWLRPCLNVRNPTQHDPASRPTREEAEAAVRVLLRWTGDDPTREGLRDTPKRVVKALKNSFPAIKMTQRACSLVSSKKSMAMTMWSRPRVPFSSHCEHSYGAFLRHGACCLLPVRDRRRRAFQACETRRCLRQTPANAGGDDRADYRAIDKHLRPRGCAVMIEAQHLCMSMRGVRKHGADTVTTQFTGIFRDDPAEQVRFLTMLRGSR